jgi:hypothetical protein
MYRMTEVASGLRSVLEPHNSKIFGEIFKGLLRPKSKFPTTPRASAACAAAGRGSAEATTAPQAIEIT